MPLGTPARLNRWFAARGQNSVVFRLGHIEGIGSRFQGALLGIASRCLEQEVTTEDLERHGPMRLLYRMSTDGYLILPAATLSGGAFTIEELEVLQEIVDAYRDNRLANGVTAQDHECDCKGRVGRACRLCHGTGRITVFDETTPDEQRMATS